MLVRMEDSPKSKPGVMFRIKQTWGSIIGRCETEIVLSKNAIIKPSRVGDSYKTSRSYTKGINYQRGQPCKVGAKVDVANLEVTYNVRSRMSWKLSSPARETEVRDSDIPIDCNFPSSKTCSNCGHVQDMPLKIRTYDCPECGLSIDRDRCASIPRSGEGRGVGCLLRTDSILHFVVRNVG